MQARDGDRHLRRRGAAQEGAAPVNGRPREHRRERARDRAGQPHPTDQRHEDEDKRDEPDEGITEHLEGGQERDE